MGPVLTDRMIGRDGTSGPDRVGIAKVAGVFYEQVPQGSMSHEQFAYDATPVVFFGRTGWGPLIVCLDTNLLIYLAQNLEEVGGSFGFDGGGFLPELWEDPIRALHDLFMLWFWRDVRFYLPPAQMSDGRLTAERARSRQSILDAFAEDFWERGGFERASQIGGEPIEQDVVDLHVPDRWPASFEMALPRKMDGVLVRAAVEAGVHVFLTTDTGILRCGPDMARFSLAIMSPRGLLLELDSSGALSCSTSGEALIPDLKSLAHFYAVFPQEDG